jgi:hypothetical protein
MIFCCDGSNAAASFDPPATRQSSARYSSPALQPATAISISDI